MPNSSKTSFLDIKLMIITPKFELKNAALIAKYLRSITAVLTVSIREERRPERPIWCNRLVRA